MAALHRIYLNSIYKYINKKMFSYLVGIEMQRCNTLHNHWTKKGSRRLALPSFHQFLSSRSIWIKSVFTPPPPNLFHYISLIGKFHIIICKHIHISHIRNQNLIPLNQSTDSTEKAPNNSPARCCHSLLCNYGGENQLFGRWLLSRIALPYVCVSCVIQYHEPNTNKHRLIGGVACGVCVWMR